MNLFQDLKRGETQIIDRNAMLLLSLGVAFISGAQLLIKRRTAATGPMIPAAEAQAACDLAYEQGVATGRTLDAEPDAVTASFVDGDGDVTPLSPDVERDGRTIEQMLDDAGVGDHKYDDE